MPQNHPTIFLLEDDADIAGLLKYHFQPAGYEFSWFPNGDGLLAEMRKRRPALVLLDIMVPGRSGLEVAKEIRANASLAGTPIIFITARTGESDRLKGFDVGADDYITKPFSPRELVLRVKKLLDRGRPAATEVEVYKFGDLLIDSPRHLVSWRKKKIDLTATEFKLLALLAQRRGRVQSREQLLRDVWEYNSLIDTRTVDTHMRRLREKLGPAGKLLDTVRGVGYRFLEA